MKELKKMAIEELVDELNADLRLIADNTLHLHPCLWDDFIKEYNKEFSVFNQQILSRFTEKDKEIQELNDELGVMQKLYDSMTDETIKQKKMFRLMAEAWCKKNIPKNEEVEKHSVDYLEKYFGEKVDE